MFEYVCVYMDTAVQRCGCMLGLTVALSAVGPSVAYNNDLSETQASENRDNPQRLSD